MTCFLFMGKDNRLLRTAWLVLLAFIASACQRDQETVQQYEEVPRASAVAQTFQFHDDIKPILDQKCIACHACNDAPCQLKLESSLGLERGASKIKVYDGSRTENIAPTRLHFDGDSVHDWRDQGFYSVLATEKESGNASPQTSLLAHMIQLGYQNPVDVNKPLDDRYELGINRESVCPAPDEIEEYAEEHVVGGMPYGVTGLSGEEYHKLNTWLEQGAYIDSPSRSLSSEQEAQIEQWETFLNAADPKSQLVSRYLYEHLFLAHLYFSDAKNSSSQFFQLVRSATAAPEAIKVISTVRPNDDPGNTFYYRIRPITDTLVHKTHIVYQLNAERMQRYRELFLKDDWTVDSLPGYEYRFASNPFLTFEAIPAKARYQFMLDEAEYFTRTFIRGPVCRGQIATDVIRDQFWVMYEDPDHEQYVNSSTHQKQATPLLGLPGQKSDLLDFGSEWLKYQKKRNQYRKERTAQYHKAFEKGLSLDNIWDGDGNNDNAFLTVFRHHDSASVERGWWGRYPRTLWLMDYPLFERTYYELVVNFNVYGSVSHQAQTRLYFDLIRNGGETNFLQLLPPRERKNVYQTWYAGSGQLKTEVAYHKLDTSTPSAIQFDEEALSRESAEGNPAKDRPANGEPVKDQLIHMIENRFADLIPKDPINRCENQCNEKPLTTLASLPAKDLQGIHHLPEVTVLRVDKADGQYDLYSILRNRAHSNVAFMFGEEDRYLPEQDTLTVMDFPISSYPNFMFRVKEDELQAFTKALGEMPDTDTRRKLIDRWGVRRTSTEFWENFHSGTEYLDQHRPLQSGVFDLNRYQGW